MYYGRTMTVNTNCKRKRTVYLSERIETTLFFIGYITKPYYMEFNVLGCQAVSTIGWKIFITGKGSVGGSTTTKDINANKWGVGERWRCELAGSVLRNLASDAVRLDGLGDKAHRFQS